MSSVRTVLIVHSFPSVSESFVVRRVARLIERGWDVHVLCEHADPEAWSMFPEVNRSAVEQRVHRRPRARSRCAVTIGAVWFLSWVFWQSPRTTMRYVSRGWRSYGYRVLWFLVRDAPLIALAPDLVHFEFGTLAVGREATGYLLGAKQVVSFQGYDITYVGLDREPGFYSPLWERSDGVLFVSDDLRRRAEHRGLPPSVPVYVVPNGIDPSWVMGADRRHVDIAGGAERPLRVLGVGRLHWKKGYEYALAAVKSLLDDGVVCNYRIIGDGEHREAVAFTANDLGLERSVTLLGARSASEVRAQLTWADVFVHAAVSEGFCIAATEAQAMGVPVVATDADGIPSNVADGVSGMIVPRRDPTAIANAIARLARDPQLRQRLGRGGAARVFERFTLDRHVEGIEGVYRAVASA